MSISPLTPGAFRPSGWTSQKTKQKTMHRPLHRLRWLFPVRDAVVGGRYFVPRFVRKHFLFWNNVTLQDQSLRDTWLSCLAVVVDVHIFLIDSRKAPPCDRPYGMNRFLEAAFSNRMPPSFTEIVGDSGCVAKSVDISSPPGPARPRRIRGVGLFRGSRRIGRKGTILNTTGVFPQHSMNKHMVYIRFCGSWVRHPETLW